MPSSTERSTGKGLMYKVVGNNSAANNSQDCTVYLEPTDPIKTAFSGTSLGIRINEYNGVITTTGDTVYTGPLAGIAPVSTSNNYYFWIQRSGTAPAYVAGTTIIVGEHVVASTVIGAIGTSVGGGTASAKVLDFLGQGMTIPAALGFAMVNLTLE